MQKNMVLEQGIVKGDTWATFINFSEKWEGNYQPQKRLEKSLPRIHELDEEYDDFLELDTEDPSQLADKIETKLSGSLAAPLDQLVGNAVASQLQIKQDLQELKRQIGDMQRREARLPCTR